MFWWLGVGDAFTQGPSLPRYQSSCRWWGRCLGISSRQRGATHDRRSGGVTKPFAEVIEYDVQQLSRITKIPARSSHVADIPVRCNDRRGLDRNLLRMDSEQGRAGHWWRWRAGPRFEECQLTKGPQRMTPLRAKNACI